MCAMRTAALCMPAERFYWLGSRCPVWTTGRSAGRDCFSTKEAVSGASLRRALVGVSKGSALAGDVDHSVIPQLPHMRDLLRQLHAHLGSKPVANRHHHPVAHTSSVILRGPLAAHSG